MNTFCRLAACVLLFALPSCSRSHKINEERAAAVVKKELSLQGTVTAQKMGGGYSGAELFIASSDSKKYVVKFIKGNSEREIYNSNVASNGGCGPKVYFSDPSKGIMIMEFLPGKITLEDLSFDKIYVALAHFLQKIHHGLPFKGGFHVPRLITRQIKKNQASPLPIAKMEEIYTQIVNALKPHLTTAPCHNDLVWGNLMFVGNECKAIDWADAGKADPYFDVATVINAVTPFNLSREHLLFRTYLGHKPSSAESAKLYLMKQVVWLKWICEDLKNLNSQDLQKYDSIKVIPIAELWTRLMEGSFKQDAPANRLIFLKAELTLLLQNAESPEFKNAVQVLTKAEVK